MIEGLAEVAGSDGDPTIRPSSNISIPFPSNKPIRLNTTRKIAPNSGDSPPTRAFQGVGLGKDRYWPLIAEVAAAAGIVQQTGQPHTPDELKSWWQKNWPRTYTQLEQKTAHPESATIAYRQDFEWFREWWEWQMSRSQSDSRHKLR